MALDVKKKKGHGTLKRGSPEHDSRNLGHEMPLEC